MYRPLAATVASLLLTALAGCGADSPAPQAPAAPVQATPIAAPIDVSLTVKASLNADGAVNVHATSNLPDGTELLGTVAQAPTGSPKRYNGYQGGVTQTLAGGTADFGPYSKQGSALPEGRYEVTVTMPVAVNQPESVRAVIGAHGENLTGPLVTQDLGNAFVMVEAKLTIG